MLHYKKELGNDVENLGETESPTKGEAAVIRKEDIIVQCCQSHL